jgi:hypothetical protein
MQVKVMATCISHLLSHTFCLLEMCCQQCQAQHALF